MKPLTISDPHLVLALQDEIRASGDARYDHRLHAILLVAQGMKCPGVASLLGDSVRTVENWINRFEREGFAGLADRERTGRPARLTEEQKRELKNILKGAPADAGFSGNLWDGRILSAYIQKSYRVKLGIRQCQRLFHRLGFRLRKPRPFVAHGDQEEQKQFKKN